MNTNYMNFQSKTQRAEFISPLACMIILIASVACERKDQVVMGNNQMTPKLVSQEQLPIIEAIYYYPLEAETRQRITIEDLKRIGKRKELNSIHKNLSLIPGMVIKINQKSNKKMTELNLRFGMLYKNFRGDRHELWIDQLLEFGILDGELIALNAAIEKELKEFYIEK